MIFFKFMAFVFTNNLNVYDFRRSISYREKRNSMSEKDLEKNPFKTPSVSLPGKY